MSVLRPLRSVVLVDAGKSRELQPSEIDSEIVGHKARGLACLPSVWTLPFIVVDISDKLPTSERLAQAAASVHLDTGEEVIVRSSSTTETIEMRGQIGDSIPCKWSAVLDALRSLRAGLPSTVAPHVAIIQRFVKAAAKGHLSNERRVAKDTRDWLFERESARGALADKQGIAIRTWRQKASPSLNKLTAQTLDDVPNVLRHVALWASLQKIRLHFEWVWSGRELYIVQADDAFERTDGESPKDLVANFLPAAIDETQLRFWRIASTREYTKYRKLQNAALYKRLAYQLPSFYVLDSQAVLKQIADAPSTLPDEMLADLRILTRQPLVIRTDGFGLPDDMRQMLPRSDELRSAEEAVRWLVDKLGPKISAVLNSDSLRNCANVEFALLAHHFLPANASAWARAAPGTPRVRIEALWGIPEGLYWYSHDVYDVDTKLASAVGSDVPKVMNLRVKQRYKSKFVAPSADGQWIVHKTDAKHDWARVLGVDEAKEIAWTTRRIAEELQEAVVVMWFVNPAAGSVSHRVLPWYHERAASVLSPSVASAHHTVGKTSLVETARDWAALKENGVGPRHRIRIEPKEPELVRNKAFAEEVAAFAKSNVATIELAGGVLSHVYYVLTNQGCNVECIDLDDFVDDTSPAEFNKLVRDNIPAAIVEGGESVSIVALKGEALLAQLRLKIIEEAFEVADARTTTQIAEELADLEEVANALRAALGIPRGRVAEARRRKLRLRGGFKQGIMLRTASVASPLSGSHSDSIFAQALAPTREETAVESDAHALPGSLLHLHIDRRTDATGEEARQVTATFGVGLTSEIRASSAFTVATAAEGALPLLADVSVDRASGRIRVRIVLKRAPDQLNLDLAPRGGESP